MENIVEIFAEVAQAFGADQEAASGQLMENSFKVHLNDVSDGGISLKFEALLDGPELAKETNNAKIVFADKTEDDILALITLKVKGDPQDAIDELKGLLEGMGITEEMWSAFANVEFKPGDGEVLIGVAPAAEELLGFLAPFLINPTWLKGDGSQDIGISLAFQLQSSCSDMLDDEPFYTHFLKGAQIKHEGKIFEASKQIFMRILNEKWDRIRPIAEQVPVLAPLLLLKKYQGELELECNEEMTETIKEMVEENMPPAAMSLKDAMGFVKHSGSVPIEMIEPFLNWVKDHYDGELRVFGQRSVGGRMTLKTPGADELVSAFLDA